MQSIFLHSDYFWWFKCYFMA